MSYSSVGGDLLIYAGVLGFASWLYSLLEWLLVTLFWPPIYRTGPRVLREERQVPIQISSMQVGRMRETKVGKYKVVSVDTVLYRNRNRMFGFHTPFPVRGTIKIGNQLATIEGRIPLGPIVFILCFLCFIGTDLRFIGVPEVFILCVIFGLFVFGVFFERSRARRAVQETLEELSLQGKGMFGIHDLHP